MKLRLKEREGYVHTSDPRKCYGLKHTFYDFLNPEALCEDLKYDEFNKDGLKLYYVGKPNSGWLILFGEGSQYCLCDVKYCPYCGEKIEVEIINENKEN